MPSRRVQKAAEAIREVVSMAILAELKDPRIQGVTVTFVEVTADMRQAKVHVSVMGDETCQRLTLRGLQSAAGFLQSKIANRIDTRYTPRLEFVLDLGVKKSLEIAAILQRVLPKAASEVAEHVADDAEHPADDGEADDAEHSADELEEAETYDDETEE
jgi:ribosome-binding factor A